MRQTVDEQLKTVFQMNKEDVEHEFAPYFYRYFRDCFNSTLAQRRYSSLCASIFDITGARNKRVLDIGCGFGIIAIHLSFLGARSVDCIDANEEKISVFQRILTRFDPPLDGIEMVLGDALSVPYKDGQFDVVVAHDVISHLRDLDAGLSEINRVLPKGGVLYIRDDNNSLNFLERRGRRKLWRKAEYGPIDEGSFRGTDSPKPWFCLRRDMIQERFPHLDDGALDFLAKETAGLYGKTIFIAVEEYLTEGRVLSKPDFKFRNPETGEYPEFEFNPYRLKNKLQKSGFSATIIKPHFSKRFETSPKAILLGLAARLIRLAHPLSLVIAPHFEIVAEKRQ